MKFKYLSEVNAPSKDASYDDIILFLLDHRLLRVKGDKVYSWRRKGSHKGMIITPSAKGKQLNHFLFDGYYKVEFGWLGRMVPAQVHRIIWMSRYGRIPANLVIDHKNGIRSDNRLSNLRLVTRKVNTQIGKTAKLTPDMVKEIRTKYLQGALQVDLAKEYKVRQGHISKVILREVWDNV